VSQRRGAECPTASEIFAQRYREYLPRVLNYVRSRVDDESLAQDLTAQAFERALTNLHTLRKEGAFGGWLFRIARNVVAEYYRRRRRHVSLEGVGDQPTADPSVEGQVVHSQEVDELRRALSGLLPREQEIIRLRFVAGLTNRAIARAMGLREGNVAVILHRALRKVRRTMESEETVEGRG